MPLVRQKQNKQLHTAPMTTQFMSSDSPATNECVIGDTCPPIQYTYSACVAYTSVTHHNYICVHISDVHRYVLVIHYHGKRSFSHLIIEETGGTTV